MSITHSLPGTSTSTDPADGSTVTGLDGFAHRFVEIGGTRLHAVVGGSGPTIVLVHGGLSPGRSGGG